MRSRMASWGWRIWWILGLVLCFSLAFSSVDRGGLSGQEQDRPAKKPADRPGLPAPKSKLPAATRKDKDKDKDKVGLEINNPRAFPGYTLIAPTTSNKTYLIDLEGRVIHSWECETNPALCVYLLENGNLLRAATIPPEEQPFTGPGAGGRVQEYTWDGELVWDYKYVTPRRLPHHDLTKMPNGNVLIVVWDKKTKEEAIAAGHRPEVPGDEVVADSIIEVKPTGKTTGEIVWEWNVWDHLVQEYDRNKPNYGRVSAHPELIDINFGDNMVSQMLAKKDDQDKLRAIGYVGNSPAPTGGGGVQFPGMGPSPDWTHINSVAYNEELDQIVLSVHSFGEIWIIDHGTTTKEAAGHTGGKRGKGGDLLYRWGNPRTYRSGTNVDQRLFHQHSADWIPAGLPGAGNMLLFNNGVQRPDGSYSSVDELVLPMDEHGNFTRQAYSPFGPDKPVWTYVAPNKTDFFSLLISGAQRLANGNTLICSGVSGTVFEVTPENEIVWKYVNPVKTINTLGGSGPGGFGPPKPQIGHVLAGPLLDTLGMNSEQKKKYEEFQKEMVAKVNAVLTPEQQEQVGAISSTDFRQMSRPGEVIGSTLQDRLKLSADQRAEMKKLQKFADDQLTAILTFDQLTRLDEMQSRRGPGGFGPPGGGQRGPGGLTKGRRGPGGPSGPGGPGGPGGGRGGPPPGFTPPVGSSLFRSFKYAADYPALSGKDLKPGKLLEEVDREESRKPNPPAKSVSGGGTAAGSPAAAPAAAAPKSGDGARE